MKKLPVASGQQPVEPRRDEVVGRRETWLTNLWFRVRSYGESENWELETGNWKLPWE